MVVAVGTKSLLLLQPLSSTTVEDDTTGTGDQVEDEIVDVVVIGAGIGGLCCAGLSSLYGHETICVEAHDTAGGVAHSFVRKNKRGQAFAFDSGPSLLSGMSIPDGTNPLRQVLDALSVADEISWKSYDGWLIHDRNGSNDTDHCGGAGAAAADHRRSSSFFKLTTGAGGEWEQAIETRAGRTARVEFERFKDEMLRPGGLSESSAYIPPFALRGDLGVVGSLWEYLIKLIRIGTKGTLLTGPFSSVLDRHHVHDKFVRQWFDYLSFALSGLDASHTQAAAIVYMMIDLHSPHRKLDYPMGGMDALIRALVTGLHNHGGRLRLNTRVERIILEDDLGTGEVTCRGVILSNGKRIRTRRGVVCNAPLWNMARILSDSVLNDDFQNATATTTVGSSSTQRIASCVAQIQKRADDLCTSGSFMHLHLGIHKDGLPVNLECHHSVLDMSIDVTAEQNMVIISIPTVFDPSLAPEGYHIVHAYTAACDSFAPWEAFLENGSESGKVGASPNSGPAKKYSSDAGYKALKEEKAEVLWRAVERVIPDVRERVRRDGDGSIAIVGTPLTHRRYNQRFRGTYGPAPRPGKDVWDLAGSKTEIDGLLACGDTTFPGIGLPGVAASGTIAANTLTSVKDQRALLRKLRQKGALQ